mmetsp:Transcript_36909/g.104160  ORF Transcript_36909/g.104160 Transcript_36909/m.104160 type:complete len:265 (-) Transcript_36909:24-818(-)
MTTWEEKHKPCLLPEDFKNFLHACNGMKLTWGMEFRGGTHPLACLNVNGLEELTLVPLGSFPKDDQGPHCTVRLHDDHADSSHKSDPVAAFDLDSTCLCGKVALMYFQGESRPQVWFQDLGCTWNYVAPTFTEYFRLLAMYRGLPNWQYAFTRHGLDPVSERWVRFICPERLAVDNGNDAPPGGTEEFGMSGVEPLGRGGAKTVKGGATTRPKRVNSLTSGGSGGPGSRSASASAGSQMQPAPTQGPPRELVTAMRRDVRLAKV